MGARKKKAPQWDYCPLPGLSVALPHLRDGLATAPPGGHQMLNYDLERVYGDWENEGGGWYTHKTTRERQRRFVSTPDRSGSLDVADAIVRWDMIEWARQSDGRWHLRAKNYGDAEWPEGVFAATKALALCLLAVECRIALLAKAV